MNLVSIAIIGCGPNGTYALERLCVMAEKLRRPLAIHVFERSGQFGAGWVHSPEQPATSMLNRIVGQITFAADESNVDADALLARELRPDFHDWCRRRFEETGDPLFDLSPEDWPRRYVHGLALVDQCRRYVAHLRGLPDVCVTLHASKVVDIEKRDGRFVLRACGGEAASDEIEASVDHVLVLTGHSRNRVTRPGPEKALAERAERGGFSHAPFAYPLEEWIDPRETGPGRVVGCLGLGLTAIDVFLYLTEGRGGRFVRCAATSDLVYEPSGREPSRIVGFSQSGIFTAARPFNAKEVDLATLEHRGIFLTTQTIDRLRAALGRPVEIAQFGTQRQLDFERHVLPVILLEMRCLYYKTLYGSEFGTRLVEAVMPTFERFVAGPALAHEGRDEAVEMLAAPVEEIAREAARAVTALLGGADVLHCAKRFPRLDVIAAARGYVATIYGHDRAEQAHTLLLAAQTGRLARLVAQWRPLYGHPREPHRHAFSWEAMIDPIPSRETDGPADYTGRLVAQMERDNREAEQGNIANPLKAACDGVWRDLRQVIAHCVDYAGLSPGSQAIFLRKYMRYHNRIANGAALEVMEKMLALIRCGLLDVSAGPHARVEIDPQTDAVAIYGPATGALIRIDCLVEARLHDLDIRRDVRPLFENLLRRGYIRPWRNPGSADQAPFEPGGVDLTSTFNPIDDQGRIEPRITFLGPPSEGFVFFQVGAARPNQNHHVLNDLIGWEKRLRALILANTPTPDQAQASAPGLQSA